MAPADGVFRLFSNAILYPHRRLEDIVAALALLKRKGIPFRWEHAGNADRAPEYATRIRAMAEEAGMAGEIAFLGMVPEPELVRLYQDRHLPVPERSAVLGVGSLRGNGVRNPRRGVPRVRGLRGPDPLDKRPPRLPVRAVADRRRDRRSAAGRGALGDAPQGRRFVEETIRWDLYAGRLGESFRRVTGRN